MKKVLTILMALALLTLTACSNKSETGNIDDKSLDQIMDIVYKGLDKEVPEVERQKVDDSNVQYYLGLDKCDFKEALASEPLMSSIAHSVVLIKANSESDIDSLKEEINNNLNPNKWVCVGVEEIKMASINDILLVVLDDEVGDKMIDNFKSLG